MKVSQEEYYKIQRGKLPETSQIDPKVDIQLKGQMYTLEYNNLAARNILKDCGFNLLVDAINEEVMGDPITLGSLFHRGLETNHPALTLDDTDRLLSLRHHPYITNRIMEALRAFLPNMDGIEVDIPVVSQEDNP